MIVTDLSNSFHPVPKNLQRIKQSSAENKQKKGQIKKKSSKLAKLEKNRFSIITKDLEHCYICTERGLKDIPRDDLHEIYGGRNRKRSIENGLVVPLCRKCHEDNEILKFLQRFMQLEYEKTYTKEEFIKLIGKSYL